MITFHGYRKCSTCRRAEQALQALGRKHEFVDITEHPPSAAELRRIAERAGVPWRKLFNTSGEQYKLLGMRDRIGSMEETEAFALLAGNGRLIKRPLVTDGKKATVGYDEETFRRTWGGEARSGK